MGRSINTVNVLCKKLKVCLEIEMCVSYPVANKENRSMGCCIEVTQAKQGRNKEIVVDIKCEEECLANGKTEEGEEILKN